MPGVIVDEIAMLAGAHRPFRSEPNVVCIRYIYERRDSSHFFCRTDISRIYTLTSYRDVSTGRGAILAYLKRRPEWNRLCGIIEFIHGDDPARVSSSPFRFSEAGTVHQLFGDDVKKLCCKIDIGFLGVS